VPVRLLTGEAYNGTSWESHSWNQVCDEESGVWVNVDATFGKPGQDYFDRDGFEEDHKDATIQGEWPEP
jgi:transglutaminase-like putative cysteine protease